MSIQAFLQWLIVGVFLLGSTVLVNNNLFQKKDNFVWMEKSVLVIKFTSYEAEDEAA